MISFVVVNSVETGKICHVRSVQKIDLCDVKTIDSHRENRESIKKIGIKNKKTNLKSHLLPIE